MPSLIVSEWLDIVDLDDRVIGRDTRANIHAAGKLHRSAHILLFNPDGEVFVQLRSANKDIGAGLWDTSAAGHVDSGESYIDCAVRELHEELGVKVDSSAMTLVGKLQPEARNGNEFTQVFTVCSGQALSLQVEEIDDGRWVSPSELNNWIDTDGHQFTDVFKIIWSQFGELGDLAKPVMLPSA